MKQLIFATGNAHKIEEASQILEGFMPVSSMKDIGCHEDIPETGDTLTENAIIKARYLHDNYGVDCFSEDTGLEIDALDGAPGVITARYAGPQRSHIDNINLVLHNLKNESNRGAQFRTVLAMILNGELHTFEGICRGVIAYEVSGNGGFGYDPIFIPEGYDVSFAEMPNETKNEISHRGRAFQAFKAFFESTHL